MSKSKSSSTWQRVTRAGLATGAATALLAALNPAPAFAVAGTLSLSSTGGPSGGGNTIVATIGTAPTSPNPTMFTTSTAVYFVVASSATAAPTCPATYPTTAPNTNLVAVTSPNVKVLAPNKIAVVVPAGVVTQSSGAIFKYAVCAFQSNTASASLIASSQYTVGTKPTIASVNGVNPITGPALGGTTITVNGTGFVANTATQTNTTATLDGEPLTDIVVNGTTSFSAKTPAHVAGGPYLIAVTTPGGTVNTLGATTTKANLFSYTNGIVVSPNTAPNYNGSVDLDVQGVGFNNLSFVGTSGSTSNSDDAHVYLVKGTYNGGAGSVNAGKLIGQQTECSNVLVIADNELLCSLPLNHTYAGADTSGAATYTAGAAQRTGKSLTVTAGSTTVTTLASGGTAALFSQQDVGLPIIDSNSDTAITAGTKIASVQSPTSATLTAVAPGTAGVVTTITTGNIAGAKLLASVTTTDRSTLTGAAGTFSQADVGRFLTSAATLNSDPKFADSTTIISVNADGSVAKLSAPITGTLPGGAVTADVSVNPSTPVSNGTYTMTVVSTGLIGGSANPSIISSGSTFTVADY